MKIALFFSMDNKFSIRPEQTTPFHPTDSWVGNQNGSKGSKSELDAKVQSLRLDLSALTDSYNTLSETRQSLQQDHTIKALGNDLLPIVRERVEIQMAKKQGEMAVTALKIKRLQREIKLENRGELSLERSTTSKSSELQNKQERIESLFEENLSEEPIEVSTGELESSEKKPPANSDSMGKMSAVTKEVLNQANKNAVFRKEENREKILKKLEQIGIPENEREEALEMMMKYVQDSKPTLNFDATDMSRLSRLDSRDNLENMWDAPLSSFDTGLVEKRDKVERSMHGYADSPLDNRMKEKGAGDNSGSVPNERPIYMGVNLGNSNQGAAPYYGKSYFQAKSSVYDKSTLSAGDSFNETFAKSNYTVGTIGRMEGVFANMPSENLERILKMAKGEIPSGPLPGNEYIEVQVLSSGWEDIGKVVLSRSEVPKSSVAEKKWIEFAEKHGFEIEFFDTAAWENIAIKEGSVKASSIYEPVVLSRESDDVTNPTQENINTFLKELELKNIPGTVSLGLSALKETVGKFTNTVNRPLSKAPTQEGGGLIRNLLVATTPYGRKYDAIQKLTKKNEKSFRSYVSSLPDDQDVLKFTKKVEEYERGLNLSNLSPKEAKKLEKLKSELKLLKERAFLKKRIGEDNLEILTSNPITHTRQYSMMVEAFRSDIDKKNVQGVVSKAKEMKTVELEYQRRLEVLSDVMKDPAFIKKAKGRKKNFEIISKQALTMAHISQGTVELFSKVAKSVEADPEGWIQALDKDKSIPDK